MLQRLWDFLCYVITGDNRERPGNKAKWDYSLWTRYWYSGVHHRGCGKHNTRGRAWILLKDFTSSFTWIAEWRLYWDAYWETHSQWI